MSLSQPALKADLIALYALTKTGAMSDSDYADKLATIIDTFVKTAVVNVTGVMPGGGSASGTLS
jgi:hypothetical protein